MKQPRMTVPTFLMAFLAAALVAFSVLMCLVDAFQMDCNPVVLLAWSCFAAAAGAGAMWFRRTGLITAVTGVLLLALALWFHAPLLESFQGFLYAVSQQYSLAYASFPSGGQEGADPTLFLMLLAIPLAWLTAWVTGREGSALLVLLACMPMLILCLIIVDIAPVLWLILLTGVLLLLLLSQSVRERNPAEGSRLAWWLVLPTVILVAGITVLWPPAAYERATWSDTLQTLAEAKVSFQTLESKVLSAVHTPKWNASLKEVDLSQIGPRVTTGQTVLEYRSSSAISYLRGVSLGVYEDNTWAAIPEREYAQLDLETIPLVAARDAAEELTLWTANQEPMLYTAYFLSAMPDGGEAVDDAYVSNSGQLQTYTVSYGSRMQSSGAYDAYVLEHYTQVPEDMLPALRDIAAQAGLTTPESVIRYVRSSGTYDLNTPRLPSGEDFVLYFLQESHRGYCVHFASAAVMLLRALDIPARYVMGYAVSGQPDTWTAVTDESVHAWVEYYVSGAGWIPLDPTPAEDGTDSGATPTPSQDPDAGSSDAEPVPSQEPDTEAETGPAEPPQAADSQDTPGATLDETPDTPSQDSGTSLGGADAPTSIVLQSRSSRWLWLLALPALVGLIVLRRWLVLRRRMDRCSRGHPNRRALTLWRWLVRLSRTDNTALPEELLSLAEKARFSQHTLSEDELSQLREALDAKIQALQAASPGKRLWYRYGLALF